MANKEDVDVENEDKNKEEPERNKEKPEEWKSCCFNSDARVIKFFTNVMFSFTLILFCISQLYQPELPPDRFTLYISLLSGAVNLWMPGPKIK